MGTAFGCTPDVPDYRELQASDAYRFDHHTPAAMQGPWPSEPLTTGNGSTGT